jgi:hypothetical protein
MVHEEVAGENDDGRVWHRAPHRRKRRLEEREIRIAPKLTGQRGTIERIEMNVAGGQPDLDDREKERN